MTKSNIQIRGNCQICGPDHAFTGANGIRPTLKKEADL